MKLNYVRIDTLTNTDTQLRVEANSISYLVTLTDDKTVDNIELWNPVITPNQTEEEFVVANSIDADVYFTIEKLVLSFVGNVQ